MFDITQGKYWKRKMATILAEYKKWRLIIISLYIIMINYIII